MPVTSQELHRLDNLVEPHRRTVWEAIYRREEQVAREAAASARQAFDDHPEAGDRSALLVLWPTLDFAVADAFAHTLDEEFEAFIADLQATVDADGELAEAAQALSQLILRCAGHLHEFQELSSGEVNELLARLPEGFMNHQCCMYLGLWAFSIRDLEHVKLAYKYFLITPIEFMVDFSRQRLKVMVALLEGRCDAKELSRLIDLIPNPIHATWLLEAVTPEAQTQGLWNDALAEQLAAKLADLAVSAPTVPPRMETRFTRVNL
jgi:hypothetical protein